jgi:hypothetical protein
MSVSLREIAMQTVEQLQDPSTLRLAMGELDSDELRIAQAAVRFAHFCFVKKVAELRDPKIPDSQQEGTMLSEQYMKGWNDCREAILLASKT